MKHFAASRMRSALTLLELLVVVVIMGLIAATVTVRIGDRLPQARLAEAASEWQFLDGQLRTRTRNVGRGATLRLELGSGAMEREVEAQDRSSIRCLPRGVRIAKYLSCVEDKSTGTVEVVYSDRGTTETFAIELVGGRGLSRWLVVAGLTGQTSELANEQNARELLQRIASYGIHAD